MKMRSAEAARFRLGLTKAPRPIAGTDSNGRLARYHDRREQHQATGQLPRLEIWRSS